jgi:hypothetical protein
MCSTLRGIVTPLWLYGRLASYEDINNVERLAQDPAMRIIVW